MEIPYHNLNNFDYNLPETKIASFPLENRSDSKLLQFKNGEISDYTFNEITELLPEDSTLIFNNTKVISARLKVKKESGAEIEIFLLEPYKLSIEKALISKNSVIWKCMIGNLKKWNPELELEKTLGDTSIKINILNRENLLVKFEWTADVSFSVLLAKFGKTPLPPYIKRDVTVSDKERYQTIYSVPEGAVAAPTAGLHFTSEILEKIKYKGITECFLTLHVGAGTFSPVKHQDIRLHEMHYERIVVNKSFIQNYLINKGSKIAVGTTSLRTLESLYWYGVKLIIKENTEFNISAKFPYQNLDMDIPVEKSFMKVIEFMESLGKTELNGSTGIFIVPGYPIKTIDAIITNFHMPKSTLIMLIFTLIGENWKTVYEHALKNNFRFLSYGDSSILWKSN